MRIITNESWNVTSSGTKTVKLCGNANGDRAISTMYLNPLADINLVVKGYVSDEDTEGVVLMAVDIANLEKAEDGIALAGNYLFIVEPYFKVVITATGSAEVLIKTLA